MGEKIDLFFIVSLIWISSAFYAGLIVYKQYVKSNEQVQITEEAVEEGLKVPGASTLNNHYKLQKKWNKRADDIRKDHRSLVESYKQRQRDHKRITANLLKRR